MPTLIAIEPAHYEAASRCFGSDIAGGLSRLYAVLLRDLADTGAMSGADASGVEWGATYDKQAAALVHAIASVQSACLKLGSMLQRTGFNHASAEYASGRVSDEVDVQPYNTRFDLTTECAVILPAGGGGSGDKPSGLVDVESAIGEIFDWPTGRPDRLRDAAGAWRTAGRSLGQLTGFVDTAVMRIRLQISPEVADAATVCSSVRTHLEDLVALCSSLAAACEDQADAIHTFQSKAHSRIDGLEKANILTDIGGGLLSVPTLGFSDVGAAVLNEVEKYFVGTQVRDDLQAYVTASIAAQVPMASVRPTAETIETLLAPILAAVLTSAAIELVPALMYRPGAVAEVSAGSRLRVAAEEAGRRGIPPKARWAPGKLEEHFKKHAHQFGDASEAAYARRATRLYHRAITHHLPMKIDLNGNIRVYDQATNTIASYAADGTIKTIFKPKNGVKYWLAQKGTSI